MKERSFNKWCVGRGLFFILYNPVNSFALTI